MSRPPGFPVVLAPALLAPLAAARPAVAFPDHLLVTVSDGVSGSLAAVELAAPWVATPGLEDVGVHAVARHALGKHWIVNGSPDDEVQVVDPDTWSTVRRFSTGAGSDPQDVIVASPSKAFVSLAGRTFVLVVDPATGAPVDSVDLGMFADADGLPDLGRLETDGARIFVQVRRIDTGGSGRPVAPSLLAVVDAATSAVVDADPGTPGIQAIELTGLFPVNDMQREGDRLYVVEQGSTEIIDEDGGLDAIDLGTLTARGFVTTEGMLGGHTDAFVLVSETKGYAITHTDWALSSHVTPFSRLDGAAGSEVWAQIGTKIDQLAYDEATGLLYVPGSLEMDAGIRVIDAEAEVLLTPTPIDVGGPPRDVLVVPGGPTGVPAGGERAGGLGMRVGPNPFRESVAVRFAGGRGGAAELRVFDVAGRLVRTVWSEATADGGLGERVVTWDGRDGRGREAAPGVYLLRLTTGNGSATRPAARVR